MVLKKELEKIGIPCTNVDLGKVEIRKDLDPFLKNQLKVNLKRYGPELLDDKRNIVIEKIKSMIPYSEEPSEDSY